MFGTWLANAAASPFSSCRCCSGAERPGFFCGHRHRAIVRMQSRPLAPAPSPRPRTLGHPAAYTGRTVPARAQRARVRFLHAFGAVSALLRASSPSIARRRLAARRVPA